ncbi:heavy-metal-associated domain-containing protein [Hyunsoonleella flava]|uniref:Heavy-metal-associated domain-containing protein n=1 Tax=Hyunsoonleella flava TaxID=2527939 RepID=A0A4Q9FDZ7_9FLAO|nr:heavy metal-associated domain-containing protein [Hyunsoonleella flava]TBN04412.1 heavy-metal-associated domain-containing protein [Hyunsoonleella flava]
MTTSLARIVVQNPFCTNCSVSIKKKIMEIEQVQNVRLFPEDALVVFNFNRANQISEVLNTLMNLGYPPEGDRITQTYTNKPLCGCLEISN